MKTTSHLAAVKAVAVAACALAAASAQLNAQANSPSMPVGWLTAYPTVVQTGTKPTLTWDISYPSVVKDFVDVTPPSTITPKVDLDVEIRVLGNGVTVTTNNNGFNFVPGEALLSYKGGSYDRIFYGSNLNVNPNTVVWSKNKIRKNETLRFGGRYYYNNSWGPLFTTSSSNNQNVRTLVNGDTPPNKVPEYGAPSLESFIRPYLGPNGKVKIGPMDVIVFMELTHTNENDSGYDLQDMVLLVTFKERK
ncbi:hypothetical protein HZ994_11705 [Akkermansiaceae bacterium]|nr:hypothetical protein HZ994_11705 [Akkermansiaceae bacterium]